MSTCIAFPACSAHTVLDGIRGGGQVTDTLQNVIMHALAVWLLSGYHEDRYMFFGEEERTSRALEEAFGAKVEDICWVTPVLDEHFTYHGSVLAGGSGPKRPWHAMPVGDRYLAGSLSCPGPSRGALELCCSLYSL